MNEAALVCKTKHKFKATTDSCHNKQAAPNLLDRKFEASAANCHWDVNHLKGLSGTLIEVVDIALRAIQSL